MRRVLLKMADEAAFFGDTVPPKLLVPFILRYMAIFLNDCSALQPKPCISWQWQLVLLLIQLLSIYSLSAYVSLNPFV